MTLARHRVVTVLRCIIAAFSIVISCFSPTGAETPQKLIVPEKATAAIHCNYAPVTFWDKNTDTPSGFAVDIINHAAKSAGLEVNYICKPGWPEMITAVETGEAHISVLLKSPEREKKLLFSTPIDITYLSYFARSQSTIKSGAVPQGYSVGVIKGSRSYEYLINQPKVNLSVEGSYQEGFFNLLAGQIDIFAGEESLIKKQARETHLEDRIRKIGKPFSEQERCLVVSRDNVLLRERLDNALKGFIGSPEYQRIYLTWYGSSAQYWTANKILMASGLILFISIFGMAYWRYKSIIRINRELVRSIDEHRRTEETLRISEAEIKEAQTIARLGRWELDLLKNSLQWSDTIFDIFELDRTQFGATYAAYLETIHPDDREMVNKAYADSLKSKQSYEVTHRLLMKDGRVKWVTEVCRTDYNSQGQAVRSVGIVQDITERKLAEDTVQQSELKYRNLFESSSDGIFILDFDGNFIDVNSTAYMRLGYTKEELLSLHISKLVHPEFASRTTERMRKIHEDGFAVFESAHLRKDGTAMQVEVNSRLMNFQGRMAHYSMIRDITERKLMETELRKHREELMKLVEERTAELKTANTKLLAEIAQREQMEAELLKAQKLESLGVLAGGIAHDFNNLLTTVMGNVSLALLDLDEGHPAHKQLIATDRALLRAQDLTQQLLTFSKGGAPVKRDVFIGDLLRESSGFALRGSRVRCEFSIPGDLWQIEVDEGQISQVIHNLAINADQAMPEGGTLRVSCENALLAEGVIPGLSSGRYVKVMVEDSGIGIPRDHLTKIFDPYFTTKQRGSGLGLATAYSIMQKHGGHISAASGIGVGATFTLYLPASTGALTEQRYENTKPLSSGAGKILIMDDDESIRQTTANALVRFGYTADFAENGGQAIELYRQAMNAKKPFDAVIMDLTIPGGMGGREALQHLIEMDPGVKAIVSSGYSNDPIMSEFRSYGFAGVVAKPYRVKQLIETVSRVIAAGDTDQGTGARVP